MFLYQYIRHLAGEIGQVWNETDAEKDQVQREKLLTLAKEIVPYHMQHNAEAEACDLIMEIEQLDILQDYVDKNVFPRVCLYLIRYGQFEQWLRKTDFWQCVGDCLYPSAK